MNIIDKRKERENVKRDKRNNATELMEKEEERQTNVIRVACDWRMLGQLDSITKGIWPVETRMNKENFLKSAINNREQLKELYVESFKYNAREKIEVEYNKDIIEMLDDEATSNGLALNEYVNSIVYTTAFNINQERAKARAKVEAEEKERTPYTIGTSSISQELKRKLENKYGKPKMDTLFGLNESAYTDMLIDIAEEYFKIKK